MKDSEFIDLLNLYLDHEISAADAARLEAEVQNNPARRKIYHEYCRMQKACAILAQDSAAEAAEERKEVAFEAPASRSWVPGWYTLGTLAAAACIAVVVYVRTDDAAKGSFANAPATAPAGVTKETAPAIAAAPVRSDARVVPVSMQASAGAAARPLLLTAEGGNASLLRSAVEEANAQFAWMQSVNVAPMRQPVSIEQLRFEARSPMQADSRTFDSRQPMQAPVEMSAFRFQR